MPPTLAGVSLAFAVHNANKRSTELNPDDENDRERFLELVAGADIVVDCGRPGQAATYGTSCADLADRYDHLVALSITDFGATGPRSSWRATDPVLYAMSGSLSRSGPAVGTPVLPPDGIASATAVAQATWCVLVAYYNRLRCGTGDYIDFSRLDGVVVALDPAFGSHGQVAVGRSGTGDWRGRPRNQDTYPIVPCQDGYVRLCVMAPRQWRGLRRWLGEPEEFQDPEYDLLGARLAAWPRARRPARGVVRRPDDEGAGGRWPGAGCADRRGTYVIADPGLRTFPRRERDRRCRAWFRGVRTIVPTGYFVVDGERAGFRTPAPAAGADQPHWLADPAPSHRHRSGAIGGYPLRGLRILDLGIIVAGGEVGRLFGDMGAEVIKVESADYPDGLRQARTGAADQRVVCPDTSQPARAGPGSAQRARARRSSAAWSASADAVFANFKPGTLTTLGFSYDGCGRSIRGSCSPAAVRSAPRAVEPPAGLWAVGARRHRRDPAVDAPILETTLPRTAPGMPFTTRRRSSPITWSGGSRRSPRWPH